MKKSDNRPIAIRMPPALVKQLDSAAKKSRRTRSAELLIRLEGSFEQDRRAVAPAITG